MGFFGVWFFCFLGFFGFFLQKRTIRVATLMTTHGGEMGTLKLSDLTRSPRMEIRQNPHMQPKQLLRHPQWALSTRAPFSSSTLPVSAKHRGKFVNLRDSVKKSPTKSTAKVKAASGWVSDGSCSNCSLGKVGVALRVWGCAFLVKTLGSMLHFFLSVVLSLLFLMISLLNFLLYFIARNQSSNY